MKSQDLYNIIILIVYLILTLRLILNPEKALSKNQEHSQGEVKKVKRRLIIVFIIGIIGLIVNIILRLLYY